MSSGYKIGVRGCQHLGYQPQGMRLNTATRWNQRIIDGHVAHELTMRSMLDAGVDGIVDGGDLSHHSRPLPRDVEAANRVDDIRVQAGVWAVGNSGNHCAGGGSDLSAMGVMHRPDLGILAVYPDAKRGVGDGIGPHPGLYEIHTADTHPNLPEGLALHFVSHYGLSRDLAVVGINVDPTPLPGHVNLFFSHGTFETDERLYHCIDPHGEERPIPTEWAHRGWDALLLSHYHTLGAVPGYGDCDRGQVWYTGSSLRRGFSDEPGVRGWLQVTVHDSGKVSIDVKPIWQRLQHDLPVIDAQGLTVSDIDDQVTAHIAAVPLTDSEAGTLTGDNGAIVRQVVLNATAAQRQGLAALRGRYMELSSDAAWWRMTFDKPISTAQAGLRSLDGDRAVTARVTDFAGELRRRSDRLLHAIGVPETLATPVMAQAQAWAGGVVASADIAEHDHAAPAASAKVEIGSSSAVEDDGAAVAAAAAAAAAEGAA